MERNTWEYVVAAIAGVAIFMFIVIWISNSNDRKMARDCDLMGVTMLNGKPYKCSRLAPDSPTPPDPGHEREGGNV